MAPEKHDRLVKPLLYAGDPLLQVLEPVIGHAVSPIPGSLLSGCVDVPYKVPSPCDTGNR